MFISNIDSLLSAFCVIFSEVSGKVRTSVLSKYIDSFDINLDREKLTYFHDKFSNAFRSTILLMANTEPISINSFPFKIRRNYVSDNSEKFRFHL